MSKTMIKCGRRGNRGSQSRAGAASLVFAMAFLLMSSPAGAQSVASSSFEAPEVGSGSVTNPTVTGATFVNEAGIAGNGSSWGFQAAPDGDQVAFLRPVDTTPSISLAVSGLTSGAQYFVRFLLAKRPFYSPATVTVSFDGNALNSFSPSLDSFAQKTTTAFTASGTSGTITFTGVVSPTNNDAGSAIDSVSIIPAPPAGVDPSFRVGEGVAVTPSAAAAQLGSATVHSAGPGYGGRSTEVKSLARALGSESAAADLGGYADRAYDYVRNRIDIEPMFGSAKGPLGTILDGRGTAFDQAQLLVELFLEGGIAAEYKFGDVTMSAADTANWLGATRPDGSFDQAVLEQMLADGGIPFTGGSSIIFSHLWVSATIGGGTYLFDPAIKAHSLIPNVAVATAMGYNRASLVSAVEAGSQAGSGTLRALNAPALDTQLNGLAANLAGWIGSNKPVSDVDDIVGGARIARVPIPAGGWRQASLPYGTSVRSTWSAANGIPDQYRSRLKLRLEAKNVSYVTGGDPLSDFTYFEGTTTYFTDEIYGHRFWIDTPGLLSGFNLMLKLDDFVLASATATQPGAARPLHPSLRKGGELTLTIDHPYAGNSGAYLDRNTRFGVDYVQPMTIVLGIGSVSERLASRHGPEMYGQRKLTPTQQLAPGDGFDPVAYLTQLAAGQIGFQGQEGGLTLLELGPYFKVDHSRTRIADAWMAQASRMGDLQARVGGGYYIQHHLLGVSYGQTVLAQLRSPSNTTRPYDPPQENVWIDQDTSRLSVDSAVSIRSRTQGASPTGMRQAVAAASAALEGSIFEQQQDQVESVSTAVRLAWANNYGSGSSCQSMVTGVCAGKVPLDFSLNVDGDFTTLVAAPNTGSYTFNSLGPGVDYVVVPGPMTRLNVYGRGFASVGFNSSFTEFLHVVRDFSTLSQKGGGGAMPQPSAREYDPHKAADILKDTFKDRSSLHGVSLANGQLSYAPPPDLTVGGEGPGTLSFQRFFSGGEGHSFGLPDGWTHNWDYSAGLSSSGAEALGGSSVRGASTSIAAFQAMQDIYGADPGALANQIEGLLIADWWRRQMTHNVVTVRRASTTEQFIAIPNGVGGKTWLAPNGSASAIAVSGAPTIIRPSPQSFVRSYDYAGMGVTWTGGNQDQVTFTVRLAPKDAAVAQIASHTFPDEFFSSGYFLPTTMTDAAGRTTTFGWTYGNALTSVTNAFGRSLTFTYDQLATEPTGAYRPLLSVADNAGQAVSFTYGNLIPWEQAPYADQGKILTQVNLPGGRAEGYAWVGNGTGWTGAPSGLRAMHTPRLREIFDANEMILAAGSRVATSRFDYDAEWRAATLLDAEATHNPGSRQPSKFLVADDFSGKRIDPLGGIYQVYYDDRGRADRYIDELGRLSLAGFDSWGRVSSRTAPESDRTQFTYDARSNVTGMIRIAKPGSPAPATLTASATYDLLFNTPTSVTDFNQQTTNLSYVQSGNGRGQISQALRPAVDGVRPQYDYTYTAKGQIDTVTTKIDAATSTTTKNYYDAVGNLTMSVVDNGGLKLATCYEYDAVGNRTAAIDGRAVTCVAP
jgi:hypothetical protein